MGARCSMELVRAPAWRHQLQSKSCDLTKQLGSPAKVDSNSFSLLLDTIGVSCQTSIDGNWPVRFNWAYISSLSVSSHSFSPWGEDANAAVPQFAKRRSNNIIVNTWLHMSAPCVLQSISWRVDMNCELRRPRPNAARLAKRKATYHAKLPSDLLLKALQCRAQRIQQLTTKALWSHLWAIPK